MTNDSGKKPQEIWMLVLDNGDRILRDFKPLKEDTFVHGITNERHHVVSKHHMVEVTHCPNCERLEGKLEAAHHWFDVTTKSNGNLIEENKRLQKQAADSRDSALKLAKQLEMFTEDNVRKVILEWKHAWMNQHANGQEDHENYFRRAFGIDANMQYDLARKIAAMAKLDGAE